MNTDIYFKEMKEIQDKIINYLDENTSIEDINNFFDDIKIHDNGRKVKSVLSFIIKISNNFHRQANFFNKIDQILQLIKLDIKKYFTNYEIFLFCKSNKRILLFFIEEQIITIDESIAKKLTTYKYIKKKYHRYFSPEIRPFIHAKTVLKKESDDEINDNDDNDDDNDDETEDDTYENEEEEEIDFDEPLPENFYEKRKIGENDSVICELIQKNLIEDFVRYTTQTSYSLNSTIKPSIYETNSLLLKKEDVSLIEYAAFYGSKEIFDYLILNNINLTQSLWEYAIHGKNADIIHALEKNKIQPDGSYEIIFKESIKCHHNAIADYIEMNYLEKQNLDETLIHSLKYYNFYFIQAQMVDEKVMPYLIQYDYDFLVDIFADEEGFDANMNLIHIYLFLIQF